MSKFEYDIMKTYEDMDRQRTRATKTGMNFCEVLALIFIVLKLTKVITWSWWWVLSPIWIPFILALILLILLTIVNRR